MTTSHREQQLLVGDGTPWQAAPVASFVVDDTGRVQAANTRSRELLPAVVPGAAAVDSVPRWLRSSAGQAAGEVGDRRFVAQPVRLAAGGTCWWLVDDTEAEQTRADLRRARERAAFLTEASDGLPGSLNLDRCMGVAARLAVQHLADAAWAIGPGAEHPVVVATADSLRHDRLRHRPEEVPGLEEALLGFPPSRRAGWTRWRCRAG